MDYSSPIAKRTRLREEEFWKKLWEERRGKRKCHGVGGSDEKWRSKNSAVESVDDDDDADGSEVKASASRPTRGMDRKKEVKQKRKWIDYVSVDALDEEESDSPPRTRGKDKKKDVKRKSPGRTLKRRSGCAVECEYVDVSDDSEEEESVEIGDDEVSGGKHDNDLVDFEHVDGATSKCGKNSELGLEKIESLGPIEDSDDEVVCLDVERLPSDELESSSSEEESDNSDDEDYNPEKPESSGFPKDMNWSECSDFYEESNSFGGEGKNNDESDSELKMGKSMKECKVAKASDKVDKGKSAEVGGKRKKSVDEANSHGQQTNFNQKKTRSYSRRNDKQNDVHEEKTGSDKRNDKQEKKAVSDDNDETYCGYPETGSDKGSLLHNGRKGDLGYLINRKSILRRKDCNVFKILVDSINEKGDMRLEGSISDGDEDQDETNPPVAEMATLPLKFTFGFMQPSAPERTYCDPEEEELWDELEFALRCDDIGSKDSNVVENKDPLPTVNEVDTATLCRRGVHQLILDEEIGLRCKFCSYLDQEIRHIVPDFITYPYGKSGMKGSETDNRSIIDALQTHESGSVPHSGCDSHANTEGTVWDLIPGVKDSMYPHQVEGFEFIWKHIAGGIDLQKLKKTSADAGNGCIISHAPGTGKTRLTIVFLQAYLKLFPTCRPLLIAPRSMLLTWEEEFEKWKFDIPFFSLNNRELSGEENKAAVNIVMQSGGRGRLNSVNSIRMLKLYSWTKKRSILGVSYQLFEKLSGADHSRARKTGLAGEMRKILLKFPGLVVFDEGHTPRNDQSYMWKAISEIKTKKRILLSGTPFQNNFQELFNTICLVRPMFSASNESTKFSRDFSRKRGRKSNVEKWQWALTDSSGKVVDEEEKHAALVKAKIAPFVNVYKGSVLQDSPPGLRNSVVVLHPTRLQETFHKKIQVIKDVLRYERLEAKISIHPSLLLDQDAFSGYWDRLKELELNPDAGVKSKFVIELIRLSNALNERVLVFSQYIDPLNIIRDLLKSQFQWAEEEEVLYMDGKCDMKHRQSSMKVFNDPSSKAKVLLASTKACCEGISLVGASRVVLLDVTWNPSVERQAISRAYRLGQKKAVFVYHLLMAGTKEEHKYRCQVDKSRLSELVFSGSDRNNASEKEIRATVSEDKILEAMAHHGKLKHIFESIALLHDETLSR